MSVIVTTYDAEKIKRNIRVRMAVLDTNFLKLTRHYGLYQNTFYQRMKALTCDIRKLDWWCDVLGVPFEVLCAASPRYIAEWKGDLPDEIQTTYPNQ